MTVTIDEDVRTALQEGLVELEEPIVLTLVQELLDAGADPLSIIKVCEAGMRQVGERYERREYYLSGLIMAGEIFRQVLEMTQPALENSLAGIASGKILLGTVRGDIHDIGKAILQIALRCFGFTVEDLGVDVPPEAFLARAHSWPADAIGLSGLLSSAYESMRDTVSLLRAGEEPAGRHVPVIIGGGMINEQIRTFVGADFWSTDALEGVRICQRILHDTGEP